MDFAAWSALSQADQDLLCQQLNPYEDWPLFKDVESEFVGRYGRQVGVDRAFLRHGIGARSVQCHHCYDKVRLATNEAP